MRRPLLLAVLGVVAVACGAPGRPPTPPPASAFPAFPGGAQPPPAAQLAEMLATGLPAPDRAAAIPLLVDDILAWDLRDLPRDPRAVPSAVAIARAAYGTLARRLGEVAADQRLARLATFACDRRGVQVTGRATALAVARFVVDHGRPRSNLVVGYLAEAAPYLALAPDARASEADRIERDLAAFEAGARSDPTCAERHRVPLIHARHALELARTGRFDAAMGQVYVFLHNAGATPAHLPPF